MIVVWVIVAILFIAVMILIHEAGHYYAAKKVGIGVEQFSIGFGPEIVGWDRNGTRYSLKWFLAGGSVRILGMDPDEEIPEEDEARGYYAAPYWKRAIVILAGSFSHLVVAVLLFFLFFWPIGYPVLTGRVGEVQKEVEISEEEVVEGPAYQAGLRDGDLITAVDGVEVHDWSKLSHELSSRPGEEVTLDVTRDEDSFKTEARLLDVDGNGYVGIEVDLKDTYTERSNPVKAVWQALKTIGQVTVLLVKGIGKLFSLSTLRMILGMEPRTEEGPRSIVGAAQLTFHAAGENLSIFIFVIAQLFLFLAIFNLIPLPPFDGGHLLVIIIEKISGRTIDIRKLMPLAWAVIIILSLVALRLAVLDILNPMSNPFKP
ncbi:MAG: M50 family metallopeptidase [Actinobacteria bacterium]|nr:M50 family metallopeptidase [Actinomycetota bacterium]